MLPIERDGGPLSGRKTPTLTYPPSPTMGPGVNRHFHMICIRDKFSQNIGRQISSKVIWDHLSTMYDMQALHESEILPFPNSEKNFILPEEIIQEVKEAWLRAAHVTAAGGGACARPCSPHRPRAEQPAAMAVAPWVEVGGDMQRPPQHRGEYPSSSPHGPGEKVLSMRAECLELSGE
uniref:MRG domain binding protein n=1 Tax=Sphenodon punctatus TaxID=8508 RepID=A0A8D0HEH9_SPHPU